MQYKNSFDNQTVKKIIRGALITGAGAILTYLASALSEVDFGAYTPIVMLVMAVLVNTVREFRKGE